MKAHLNKSINTAGVSVTLSCLAALGLMACGKTKSDQQYRTLMDSHPISYQEQLKQNAMNAGQSVPGVYVTIATDKSAAIQVHEGATVTITGTAVVHIPNLDFHVSLKSAPTDVKFSVVNDGGVRRWSLVWKTPIGKIPAGKDIFEVQPVVSVTFPGALSEDNKKLLGVDLATGSTNLGLDIKVSKVSDTPIIQHAIGLQNNPTEGIAVPFEIDVNDPGALGTTPPVLKIGADKTRSSVEGNVDVSAFIKADASKPAQSSGDGVWKFFYIFNSGDTLLPRPAKHSSVGGDEVSASFFVVAVSPSKLTGSQSQFFNLKLNTVKQAPVFSPKDASQSDHVTMGQLNQIDIDVKSNEPAGKLKIDAGGTHGALKLLPGQAQAKCDAQSGDEMVCHIRWTPSCTATADATESVQLKVTNSVGGISAPGVWSQDLKMVKPGNCGVKTKAATKGTAAPPAPKVAKTKAAADKNGHPAAPVAAPASPAAAGVAPAGAKTATVVVK